MTEIVSDFTLHDSNGNYILEKDSLLWIEQHEGLGFGPVVAYSWRVNGKRFEAPANRRRATWEVLPDASGFICLESDWKPDNCLLLDVFGKERMRLTVPWQLTRAMNLESAKPPTSFARVSAPFVNPSDGKAGEFGVIAWVELAGHYYFELNYHTGDFLWGREIRD